MKATVKKTVLRTVFRERADESIQFALNRSGEMEHHGITNTLVLRQNYRYPNGYLFFFYREFMRTRDLKAILTKNHPPKPTGEKAFMKILPLLWLLFAQQTTRMIPT